MWNYIKSFLVYALSFELFHGAFIALGIVDTQLSTGGSILVGVFALWFTVVVCVPYINYNDKIN